MAYHYITNAAFPFLSRANCIQLTATPAVHKAEGRSSDADGCGCVPCPGSESRDMGQTDGP